MGALTLTDSRPRIAHPGHSNASLARDPIPLVMDHLGYRGRVDHEHLHSEALGGRMLPPVMAS